MRLRSATTHRSDLVSLISGLIFGSAVAWWFVEAGELPIHAGWIVVTALLVLSATCLGAAVAPWLRRLRVVRHGLPTAATEPDAARPEGR